MDEEDRLMLRTAAQLEVQTSIAIRDRLLSEISTSLRWIQASLLLVNGGGAVAVLQSATISAPTKTLSGAFFVVGVVLSLLSGWVGVVAVKDVPRKLSEAIGYWIGVSISLNRSETIEREWNEYAQGLERRGRPSRALGWGSVAAFVIGCVIAGTAL
jgi:hypothetical protein